MYVGCVALLLLAIGQGTDGIPLENFYPFGSGTGDSRLPSNDDGSSGSITLSFTFPFFGTDYRMVYVSSTHCNYILRLQIVLKENTSISYRSVYIIRRMLGWGCKLDAGPLSPGYFTINIQAHPLTQYS